MKKINLIIITIIIFACNANAQRNAQYGYLQTWNGYYNFGTYGYLLDDEYKISYKHEKDKIAKAGIKEFTETHNKKGKTQLYSKLIYDTHGNCTLALFNKKNGTLKRQFAMEYSPSSRLMSKAKQNPKGKEIKKATYGYDGDSLFNQTVLYRHGKEIKKNVYASKNKEQFNLQEFYRKGKLKKKITSTYDSTRIMESYYYKNGSANYTRKWVYTYYDNKTKKSSTVYKANGKVKYTWNYDCKPDGEMQTKHKDTTMICEKMEYDADSNKTYTYRTFDEKGKPRKSVYKYTKDRKLLQQAVYHDNDIPSYSFKYNPATSEIAEQIFYTNKGVENFKMINTFDANNNITETSYYQKGKSNSKSMNQYNANNLITSTVIYGKKNQVKITKTYNYTNF